MALVHVPGPDVEAERAQHPRAADAQNDLLLEAVGAIAAVEVMRQRPVERAVLFKVGVEQQDRGFLCPVTPVCT